MLDMVLFCIVLLFMHLHINKYLLDLLSGVIIFLLQVYPTEFSGSVSGKFPGGGIVKTPKAKFLLHILSV